MKNILLLAVLFAFACTSKKQGKDAAIGLPGKINIIMTPEKWDGPIGQSIDSILTREMTVLPRPENIFKIRHVDPENLNASMKRTRNIIFLFTLDDNSLKSERLMRMLTPETINQMRQDTSLFMKSVSDVYARGQEVLYLFGPDEKTLLKKIRKYGNRIADNFNIKERTRLTKALLNATSTKGITQTLEKDRGFTIKVPFGYRLADNQNDFVWLRQINPADDKDIFVSRKPYTSKEDFKKENLIKFRNEICQKYLFEDPEKPDTYLITETSIEEKPVELREINFNGSYAVEMKGLWKTNIKTMGGPFMGFALVDEKNGLFYYIEGFTYSPSRDQREIMRELETILYSFRVK